MSERHAVPLAIVHRAPNAARVLQERGLLLVRAVWVALLVVILCTCAVGLPTLLAQMHSACMGTHCAQWQAQPSDLTTLHHLGFSTDLWEVCFVLLDGLLVLEFCVVAGLLCWSRSPTRMAMFCAFMLLFVGAIWSQTFAAAASHGGVWNWIDHFIRFLGPTWLIVFFYLFPSGRFYPGWTRWIAGLCLVGVGVIVFIAPRALVSDSAGPPLIAFGLAGALATAIIAQIYRYRRISGYAERQQTKWVISGFVLTTVLFAGLGILFAIYFGRPSVLPSSVRTVTFILLGFNSWRFPFLLLPLAIGIAILRHGLFDIDVFINRTLVYATLTVGVVAFYVVVVAYLGALFHAGDNTLTSLVATGLIAIFFQPFRERLQRGVNRLMYGERDNPYEVLSRLNRRLEVTLAPQAMLLTIVEAVVQALKLPYAAITVENAGDVTVAASFGAAPKDPVVIPLAYGEEVVGRLLLAPRAPGEIFGRADRLLLNDLAAHAGMAVYAVRTTTDLRQSQERLVTAREEERRRLRGDLHDGLGPTLASLSQRMEVAGALVPRQPEAAVRLLGEMKVQVVATITDIRRLVYALRPPTLDEYGLIGAIRDHASQYGRLNGLQVSVEAPDVLPSLPAAVEVAAYRIVLEALTNVIRHADAQECRVDIRLEGGLTLEIVDNGAGLPQAFHAGVGVTSMRQRAVELGGSCVIESLAGRGTRVLAYLPVAVG